MGVQPVGRRWTAEPMREQVQELRYLTQTGHHRSSRWPVTIELRPVRSPYLRVGQMNVQEVSAPGSVGF